MTATGSDRLTATGSDRQAASGSATDSRQQEPVPRFPRPIAPQPVPTACFRVDSGPWQSRGHVETDTCMQGGGRGLARGAGQ